LDDEISVKVSITAVSFKIGRGTSSVVDSEISVITANSVVPKFDAVVVAACSSTVEENPTCPIGDA
jgi:hypothetical protein